MEEKWIDIKGFEGKYSASNRGEIRSENYLNTGKPKVLKPKVNKQGYLEVTLNKDNKHYYKMVARLVYEAFSEKKLNRNDILIYLDNDKTNCSFDNLKLITRGKMQENTYSRGKRAVDRLGRRYLVKYEFYDKVATIKQLAKEHNISPKTIRNRVNRQRWNIYEAVEVPITIYNRKAKK